MRSVETVEGQGSNIFLGPSLSSVSVSCFYFLFLVYKGEVLGSC